MEKRQRKFSTSIQLTEYQFEVLERIVLSKQGKVSNSEILRDAFNLYIQTKYPQFAKRNN